MTTTDPVKMALLHLGIVRYIAELVAMDTATFEATFTTWIIHTHDDPAWSEAMHYRAKNGKTQEAYHSVCKKVACLAFAPGGIAIFGARFRASRNPNEDQLFALERQATMMMATLTAQPVIDRIIAI